METSSIILRILSVGFFIYTLHLIHEQRLKVGSSWFLLLLSLATLLLTLWPGGAKMVSIVTGMDNLAVNILVVFVILLLMLVINSSVVIAGLTSRIKELGQEMTLVHYGLDNLQKDLVRRPAVPESESGVRQEA